MSRFTWGTVTAVGPVRVQLDGDSVALPFTPDSLVDPAHLGVGDRVRCEQSSRRVNILGRSGGPLPMRLSFPTKTALDAFTGWPGLIGFVEADNSEYLWRSGWVLWNLGLTPYTPGLGNFTLGDGTVDARYAVVAGIYHVTLKITLGSTSSVSGVIVVAPPKVILMSHYGTLSKIGEGTLFDASAGSLFDCAVLAATTSNLHIRVASLTGSYVSSSVSTSSTVPFTWATGDTIFATCSYVPA